MSSSVSQSGQVPAWGRGLNVFKGLRLFRALIPSWRFFDEIGQSVTLYYRLGDIGSPLGPWLPVLDRAERHAGTLFLNSHGNWLHACHSLVEHLVNDLEDWDREAGLAFEESVSFQLVKKLVVQQIESVSPGSLERRFNFQFKVSAAAGSALSEDLLVSSLYEYPVKA